MIQTIVIGSGTGIYNEPEMAKVTTAGRFRRLGHVCTMQEGRHWRKANVP
jgi:hypothetical protein